MNSLCAKFDQLSILFVHFSDDLFVEAHARDLFDVERALLQLSDHSSRESPASLAIDVVGVVLLYQQVNAAVDFFAVVID